MKNVFFIIVIAFAATACGGASTTDSTTVAVDTVTVQSVNPGVEGQVPTDSVK